jgi:acyl-CoA thioesterase-1
LPVGEVEKNLTEAIEMAKAAKVKVILGGVYAPPNYGKDYVDKFKAVYPKIAKKLNVPLVPFILEGVAGHSKLNLSDNMHPNEAGHKIMAEHIYKSIKDQL